MGYCHCESCRHWSAGPVNAFSLWQPGAVTVTKGAGPYRDLRQDAHELAQMVQGLRRAFIHGTSAVKLTGSGIPGLKLEAAVHVNISVPAWCCRSTRRVGGAGFISALPRLRLTAGVR